MNWAHHVVAGDIFVVADSASDWLEAAVRWNRRTETVIEHPHAIFAQFGVLLCLVSDNAPELVSQQLSSSVSCRLVHSPEYDTQSSDLAELVIRVVKERPKSFNSAKSLNSAFIDCCLCTETQLWERVKPLQKSCWDAWRVVRVWRIFNPVKGCYVTSWCRCHPGNVS